MSITRRQFLLFIPGAATGFILPSYLTQATEYLKQSGEPLLIPADGANINLYAVQHNPGSPYILCLHEPDLGPPEGITWNDFADQYVGIGWDAYVEEKLEYHGWYLPGDEDEFDGDPAALESHYPGGPVPSPDDLADERLVWESWPTISPRAEAYGYLEEMDLGPELDSAEGSGGEIRFIDGEHPGSDILEVDVPDLISLSLLQERLNQINSRVRIIVQEAEI